MRPLLLCSLLLACVPEDKSTSTSSTPDTTGTTSSATSDAASSTTADATSDATSSGVTSSGATSSGATTSGVTSSGTTEASTAGTTGATGACEGLDEAACLADPACMAHQGAPHVMQNGMVCVDYNAQQFLACGPAGPACPPVVITVCPIGQPDMAFDVGSGCTPPGYELCMDGPVPDCP